jgi:hypothetical protein
VITATISVSHEREAMGRAEDDAGREIAKRLEQRHPLWFIVYYAFTREFLCLPRFAAPQRLMVVTIHPKTAEDRMSKVERLYRIREGLRQVGERASER